jgi:molybdopterin molybdotransferase
MLSVEAARARIVALVRPGAPETVPLSDSWGRVTAAPVVARLDQPPADVSAMDGYALRAGDAGARRVIGAAPAGHPFAGAVAAGEAVRIFTGGLVPEGADSILIQEDADAAEGQVVPREAPRAGAHIRRRGQDFRAGEVLIPACVRLDARGVGLSAAANAPWITVHRRPTVAILATGDEIALPGEPVPPGGIVSSNAHALAALVRARGGAASILPVAADTPEALARAAAAVRGVDVLVTTGGASVGEHDLVQAGLAREGFALDFWKIAMRPGKPLIAGRLGATAVLGLPGNPVSALVCAVLFLGPMLDRLQGLPGDGPPVSRAVLGAAMAANDQRADHVRARLEERDGTLVATPFPVQDSSMLRTLHQASALVLRAPHAPAIAAGEAVSIIRLDQLGI